MHKYTPYIYMNTYTYAYISNVAKTGNCGAQLPIYN